MSWCKFVISLFIGIVLYVNKVNANCNPIGTFICDNGDCISISDWCDGDQDCADNSDEKNCTGCLPQHFDCGDECIRGDQRCDGIDHCNDGSDEANCTECSTYGAFTCTETGTCVGFSRRCSFTGREDCPNGEDEKDCPEGCIDDYYFTCKDMSSCEQLRYVCDAYSDCSDGSDEQECDRFAMDNVKLCYRDPQDRLALHNECPINESACTPFFTEQMTITVDKEAEIIITGYNQVDVQVLRETFSAQAPIFSVSTSLQLVRYLDVEIKWSDSIAGEYTVTSFETCSQHHYCEFVMCEI